MRRHKIAISLPFILGFALAGHSSSAEATVIIKTFQFSIYVTGMKSPDACKNAGADAHVVVSDDKMESLDATIGQAASILAVPGKGAPSSPSREDRHQHRHLGQVPQ
jgi:hypothetical protein